MATPPPCLTPTETRLRIIGSDLTRHDISLDGCPTPYSLTPGSTIRSTTTYNIQSKPVGANVAGEIVTNIRAEPRTIICPIVIHGDTETELETAIGNLEGFLSTIEGICRLVWRRADGTQREIGAHYVTGADTITIENLGAHRHAQARLTFRAVYPYWQAFGAGGDAFGGNFLDASFAGITHTTWTNEGDVRSWPDFTIAGPCERIELGNVTTGQLFRIIEVLQIGQEARIETDPRNRGVYLDDVWRPDIIDPIAADMWPLLPGDNHIVLRAISPSDTGSWIVRWGNLYGAP